jgi:hypothetical protein
MRVPGPGQVVDETHGPLAGPTPFTSGNGNANHGRHFLLQHVDLAGREAWEFAAGEGYMVKDMRRRGARVFASDIVQRNGFKLDAIYDFVSGKPAPTRIKTLITNPPLDFEGGRSGKLAEAIIDVGLRHIGRDGVLALLLPCDFDSGITRWKYFGGCDAFADNNKKKKPQPQENRAWFLWSWRVREQQGSPELRYARVGSYQRRSQKEK